MRLTAVSLPSVMLSSAARQFLAAALLTLAVTSNTPWATAAAQAADASTQAAEQATLVSEKATLASEEVADPFEGFNRAMFSFNDTLDVYALKPLAQGYDFVVPDPVESSITNFFRNLRSPVYMINDLLQFRFHDFSVHTSRFILNSTIGVLGLFDVAKHFELEHQEQDFGLTLGRYGMGSGPYLVLPILGPSSGRDFLGSAIDRGIDPTTYTFAVPDLSWEERLALDVAENAIEVLNTRSRLLDTIESAKEASLDYYLFVRSAYSQQRRALVENGDVDAEAIPTVGADTAVGEEQYLFEDEDAAGEDEYIFEDDE